jgi:hypothetical protein
VDRDAEEEAAREALRRLLAGVESAFVDLGDGLGRREVWGQARWEATEARDRPARAEYFEGLGWVVAVRVTDLN